MKAFEIKKKDRRTELEKEFDEAVKELRMTPISSKDYDSKLARVEKLEELRKAEREAKPKISPDAILGVAGGALQILLITQHERLHNLSSKALGFVRRR